MDAGSCLANSLVHTAAVLLGQPGVYMPQTARQLWLPARGRSAQASSGIKPTDTAWLGQGTVTV